MVQPGIEVMVSGMAVVGATSFTHPIDVVKVRLQLDKKRGGGAPPSSSSSGRSGRGCTCTTTTTAAAGMRRGLVVVGANVVQREGLLALWSGIAPALMRSALYGGIRLGLYGPVKERFYGLPAHEHRTDTDAAAVLLEPPGAGGAGAARLLLMKVSAGVLSGLVGSVIAHPLDVIKVRQQASIQRVGMAAVVKVYSYSTYPSSNNSPFASCARVSTLHMINLSLRWPHHGCIHAC